ncbi:MAG: DUF2157 domain-containing protein [Bacilli bacterium]|nr:DUF2157 domain-containing protein [Bacilli bacterium]
MPICKNCGSRIEKFNKDFCPICGCKSPFAQDGEKTVEITSNIEVGNSGYQPKKKSTMLMFFIFFGFFGIPFFYLKQIKSGIILMIINLIGIGALSFIFAFYAQLPIYWSVIIAILLLLVVNTVAGLVLFRTPNLKDGNGEFVI